MCLAASTHEGVSWCREKLGSASNPLGGFRARENVSSEGPLAHWVRPARACQGDTRLGAAGVGGVTFQGVVALAEVALAE